MSQKGFSRILIILVILGAVVGYFIFLGKQQKVEIIQNQWPQFGPDLENSGRSPYSGPKTNRVQWIFKEGRTDCRFESSMSSPVVDQNGNIYFTNTEGFLIAMSPDKKVLWKFKIPDAYRRNNCDFGSDEAGGIYDYNIDFPPVIDSENIVYFGTSGINNAKRIYAVEKGNEIWRFDINGPLKSPIKLGNNNNLYFATNKTLYVINRRNVKDYKTFSLGIPGASTIALSEDEGVVYACTQDSLVALTYDLKLKWQNKNVGSLRNCHLAVNPDTGVIYLPAGNQGKLYAVDSNGTIQWTANIFWSEASPSIAQDGTIYVAATDTLKKIEPCKYVKEADGVLMAFDSSSKEKWRFYVPPILLKGETEERGVECYDNTRATDSKPIIGKDGTIYFGTDVATFFALNPNGKELWRFGLDITNVPLDEFDNAAVIASDGTMYIGLRGARSGAIFAIHD